MLKVLRLENFRCFQTFELPQLGKLNLLVGTNNSGKTSILEAVQLLTSQFSLETLREIMLGRGEYILSDDSFHNSELDIRHLFYDHEIDVGSSFSISNINSNDTERITISIESSQQPRLFEDLQELVLVIESSRQPGQNGESIKLPLSAAEGLPTDYVRRVRRDYKTVTKAQFVTSSSLHKKEMIDLFNKVVLTSEEDFIIAALQIIEPKIERVAPTEVKYRSDSISPTSRNSFKVRLSDREIPIPIGSMGAGIWRILGLTLAIVNARNGVLLVDEIDTGLHFSIMADMWKLIWETAKRLNVQVFATTHSSDCWTSLATIANTETPSEEGITIHRIEKGKSSSVVFTERQIAIAAERGIEVR